MNENLRLTKLINLLINKFYNYYYSFAKMEKIRIRKKKEEGCRIEKWVMV
jgi:hypothetical protein